MSRGRAYTRLQLKRWKRKARNLMLKVWGPSLSKHYKDNPEALSEAVGIRASTRKRCQCCHNHVPDVIEESRAYQGVGPTDDGYWEGLYDEADAEAKDEMAP